MKWFICSDIHGSEYYCREMLNAFDREKADKLLLLGDVLYHGPRNDLPKEYNPKAVISLLNARKDKILCVRGNCDTEVDQMVLEFPVLADYAVLSDSGITVYATHGHIYNEAHLPPLARGDVLLHGHTHVPKNKACDGFLCLNPGSCSIPKEGSHHGYLIWENGEFTFKTFDGEVVSI